MPVMEVEVRYGARHGNGETLSVKRGETLGELEKGMEEGRRYEPRQPGRLDYRPSNRINLSL